MSTIMTGSVEGLIPQEITPPTLEGFSAQDLEYVSSIEGLRQEQWEQLSVQERLHCLQILETKVAEIQGRPPCSVVAEKMPKMTNAGYFDGHQIHINLSHVERDDFLESVVNTLLHEGRHAYQHYAVAHPGFHPFENERLYWENNLRAYFSPNDVSRKLGFEYFQNQPLEVDARRYADALSKAILSQAGAGADHPFAAPPRFLAPEYLQPSSGTAAAASEGHEKSRFEDFINSLAPAHALKTLAVAAGHASKYI